MLKKTFFEKEERKKMDDQKKKELLDHEDDLLDTLAPDIQIRAMELKLSFPDFFIIDLLGSGAYGTVWRVRDLKDNIYIIKQMFVEDGDNEIKILELVKKNCKKYYPCILLIKKTSDYNYVVLENTPGYITLQNWIFRENKFLDSLLRHKDEKSIEVYAEKVSIIACKLFEVIDHLHNDDKIVHNDIKPTNILVDPKTYDIKLIDFGLACNKCEGRMFSGSGYYSPPEMPLADEKSDFNFYRMSDMYALGVTIFYMLYQLHYHSTYKKIIQNLFPGADESFRNFAAIYKLDPTMSKLKVLKLSKIYRITIPNLIEKMITLLSLNPSERETSLKC